jgi:hypothetical protein
MLYLEEMQFKTVLSFSFHWKMLQLLLEESWSTWDESVKILEELDRGNRLEHCSHISALFARSGALFECVNRNLKGTGTFRQRQPTNVMRKKDFERRSMTAIYSATKCHPAIYMCAAMPSSLFFRQQCVVEIWLLFFLHAANDILWSPNKQTN